METILNQPIKMRTARQIAVEYVDKTPRPIANETWEGIRQDCEQDIEKYGRHLIKLEQKMAKLFMELVLRDILSNGEECTCGIFPHNAVPVAKIEELFAHYLDVNLTDEK